MPQHPDALEGFVPLDQVQIQEEEVQEEISPFPTLEEVVADERFQGQNRFEQAHTLLQFRNEYADYIVQEGLATTEEEYNEQFEFATQQLRNHVDPNSISGALAATFGLDPRQEAISGMAGLADTMFDVINRSARSGVQVEGETPESIEADLALMKEKFSPDFKGVKDRLEAQMERDPERIGREFISGGELNLTTIGIAANQLLMDIPLAAAAGAAAGPIGPVAYFSLTAAARSDRTQRMLADQGFIERSQEQRLGRALGIGFISGSLDAIGFGYLTNGIRSQLLNKTANQFIDRAAGTALGRVAAAGGGEAITEFGQSLTEALGNNAEGFDDIVTMLADYDTWKDAGTEAVIGGLIGTGVRGGLEVSTSGLRALMQTEGFQTRLKTLNEQKDGLDMEGRTREPIADLGRAIQQEGQVDPSSPVSIRDTIESDLSNMMSDPQFLADNNIDSSTKLRDHLEGTTQLTEMQNLVDILATDENVDASNIIDRAIKRQFHSKKRQESDLRAEAIELGQEVPVQEQNLINAGILPGQQTQVEVAPVIDAEAVAPLQVTPARPVAEPDTGLDFATKEKRREGALGIIPQNLTESSSSEVQPVGVVDSVKNGLTRQFNEWFTKERNVGSDLYAARREGEGKAKGQIKEAELLSRQLGRQINTHLGKVGKQSEINALNDYLAGDKRNAAQIPQDIRNTLDTMRQKVDDMTEALIDVGAISGDLVPIVRDRKGVYLHRAYKQFMKKNWKNEIPDVDVEAARVYFRDQLLESAHGKTLTEAQVQDSVDGLMAEVLDQPSLDILGESKAGSKNIDVLRRRKELPVEIRNFLGEIKDPRANFLNSINRMSYLEQNQKFLNDMKDIGSKEGWLSTRPSKRNPRKYSSENSRTTDPLNGMYIEPQMESQIKDLWGPKQRSEWHKRALKYTGYAKITKTALSIPSQIRNAISNGLFMVAGGYYQPSLFRKSGSTLLNNLGWNKNINAFDQAVFTDRLKYYSELGIIDDSINVGEVQNILKDADRRNENLTEYLDNSVWRSAKKGYDKALELYSAGDDLFKIVAFEGEKVRYEKAGVPKTDREIAEIVTNIMPTYSKTGKFVDRIRAIPFVGTFPSFPAEIVRTTWNHVSLGVTEMKSDNKALVKIGAARLLRLGAAWSIPSAIAALGADLSDEEERQARRLVPPWSRYSNLVFISDPEDGKIRYIDTGHSDPFGVLKQPALALVDSEGGVKAAIIEFADPFMGEDMVTSRVLDILRNKKKGTNAKVFEETDEFVDKSNKMFRHFMGAFEVGTYTSIKRIYEGYTETVNDFGTGRNTRDEVIAFTTGTRFSQIDGAQAIQFKMSEMNSNMSSVKKDYNKEVFSQRSGQTLAEFTEAFERFKTGQKLYFDNAVKDIQAAKFLGVSDKDLRAILKASNVSKSLTGQLMNNNYREPSMDSRARAKERALKKETP